MVQTPEWLHKQFQLRFVCCRTSRKRTVPKHDHHIRQRRCTSNGLSYVKHVDGGHNVVLTEQGKSASHMAAARLLDTISRLPGMAGEANDAVSAYAQVLLSEPSRLLRLPAKERPQVWMRLPPSRKPKQWDSIDEPVASLERTLYRIAVGKTYRMSTSQTKLKRSTNLEKYQCFNVLSVMWTTLRWLKAKGDPSDESPPQK